VNGQSHALHLDPRTTLSTVSARTLICPAPRRAAIPEARPYRQLDGQGKTGGYGSDTDGKNFSSHSFGAQFVEVEWDPGICHLRVSRVVSVVDAGRIINAKTARNQMAGAPSSRALALACWSRRTMTPATVIRTRTTSQTTVVPTSADHPEIDVHFLDIPDPMIGAVWRPRHRRDWPGRYRAGHYCGRLSRRRSRVRNLPVRIEDLTTANVLV